MITDLTNDEVIDGLRKRIGDKQVLSKLIERTSRAGDASIYRLLPRVVVQPRHVDDVQSILEYCRTKKLYLTFRAAGTSLSGQAVTDGILVDVATHWKKLRILDEGRQVCVEPGVIGAHVNAFLAKHSAKMGPDPASIGACMMGGIAANNASGMCCGVQYNSYNTMASMKLVLADGFSLDTADAAANEKLREERPEIYDGLLAIRTRILSNTELTERIRRKYQIKNTCGYSMNAFVDFDRPVDILSHLLIGSEGTLGFIAEITLNTLPDKPVKATALVYFLELVDAGASIAPLCEAGAAVLEIMDRASMLSVAHEMNYEFEVAGNCAALLIEFQEDTEEALRARLEEASTILSRWPLLAPVSFTRDPVLQATYWHMRKGLFPSVGGMRELGTAVIIEDVCVSPARLADCIADLQAMFVKHSLPDAIIFGHAKDGNLHFVICNDFSDAAQVNRYAALMDELMQLIVTKYDGSLKAEHGTGRNVAPFVESEWGPELYGMMWDVKNLLDPQSVLNPGVILNRDPRSHLANLKVMPVVSPVVDKCIECGFCEPRCPSRDLTVTPRQRIAVLREVERLRKLGNSESSDIVHELLEEYEYYGNQTCATDGMCATSCPVKINTGEMIKDLRSQQHSPRAHRTAISVARHFGLLAFGARMGLVMLRLTGPIGLGMARASADIMHRLTGGVVPRLPKQMPVPGPAASLPRIARGPANGSDRTVVYFPSCLTRSMGALPGEPSKVSVAQAVVTVLEKCGYNVILPKGIMDVCCGQPFYSKGYNQAGSEAARRTLKELWEASSGGKYPVISDTSPCSGQLAQCEQYLQGEDLKQCRALTIYDFPAFMARIVIPEREAWPQIQRNVVLHPTCTLIKMGGVPELKRVASTFAAHVTIPVMAECCGFAGDRGFNYPELTLSATGPESSEVVVMGQKNDSDGTDTMYYSTCRTCEIGMTAGTGKVYQSIAHLCYDALVD